jgi:predicted metallo-beta-lactamase superfamily hydrolase
MSWLKKRLRPEKAQANAETLTRVVEEMKRTTDHHAMRDPSLEDQVKQLDNKILDSLTELRARELCLERTTTANDDLQCQGGQLTKKLKSKNLFLSSLESHA